MRNLRPYLLTALLAFAAGVVLSATRVVITRVPAAYAGVPAALGGK